MNTKLQLSVGNYSPSCVTHTGEPLLPLRNSRPEYQLSETLRKVPSYNHEDFVLNCTSYFLLVDCNFFVLPSGVRYQDRPISLNSLYTRALFGPLQQTIYLNSNSRPRRDPHVKYHPKLYTYVILIANSVLLMSSKKRVI